MYKSIILGLFRSLNPLFQSIGNAEKRDHLFAELGWDFSIIPNFPFSELDNALSDFADNIPQLHTFLTDPPSTIPDFLIFLNDVKDAFAASGSMFSPLNNTQLSSDIKTEFNNLNTEIFDFLIIRYLEKSFPSIMSIAELLGVVSIAVVSDKYDTSNNLIRKTYVKKTFKLQRISDLISGNFDNIKIDYYGSLNTALQNSTAATTFADKLFPRIAAILESYNFKTHYGITPTYQSSFSNDEYDSGKKILYVKLQNEINNFGLALNISSIGEGDLGFVMVPFGTFNFEASFGRWLYTMNLNQLPSYIQIKDGAILLPNGFGDLNFDLRAEYLDEGSIVGFNIGETISFICRGAVAHLFVKSANGLEVNFEMAVKSTLTISKNETDGFINKVIPGDGIIADFELGIGYSNKKGIYFIGGGGFNIDIPIHKSLMGINFNSLSLSAGVLNGEVPLQIAISFDGKFGPIAFVVDKIGVSGNLDFPNSGNGNLGKLNVATSFKPPSGIGLQLSAKNVEGGGYLYIDKDKGRYYGAVEIDIFKKMHITAIGIVTTKNPDGTPGFSMLVLVCFEFPKAIPLAFGFSLKGVGGMLGVNRSLNDDPIRDGIRSGAINNIMFPKNVVENIQSILSDLEQYFPQKQNQYTFGLFFLLKWGVGVPLADIKIGVIITLPNPVKLAIIGVIKITLPTEDADILRINIAFVGIIDFDNKYLTFDAEIYDSKLLMFSLAGSMAMRLFWGEQKEMLLSVGGFHPAFNAQPFLKLRPMTRLTISIIDEDILRIVFTTYFAVTSNTVQFGAALDFRLQVSEFKIVGLFGFDVLFQFNPFKFLAHAYAGLAVLWGEREILCISLDMNLEGPGPWHAVGKGEFKALGMKHSANFDKTWGEKPATTTPSIDVTPKLDEALRKDENWQTTLPRLKEAHVRFLPTATNALVFNPLGELIITQKALPLKVKIERYGNDKINDPGVYEIAEVKIESVTQKVIEEKESFAPAQFRDMDDDKKLKAASFEYYKCGVKVQWTDNTVTAGHYLLLDLDYDVTVIDNVDIFESAMAVVDSRLDNAFTSGGLISTNIVSKQAKAELLNSLVPRAGVVQEKYQVVTSGTLKDASVDNPNLGNTTFNSRAEAITFRQNTFATNPALTGALELMPV